MGDYYFKGDPAIDSTRRHLERILNEPPRRRWPWLVAMFAGGAAFTFWRRSHRGDRTHLQGSHGETSRLPVR